MSDGKIREGLRVVYAGTLPGLVKSLSDGAPLALVQLDNGSLDWLRTDQLVPEGEDAPQEPTPEVYRDRAGFLWLEAEPGSRRVFCFDAPVRRRMGDKWPTTALADAEEEFGPLDRMVPEDRNFSGGE